MDVDHVVDSDHRIMTHTVKSTDELRGVNRLSIDIGGFKVGAEYPGTLDRTMIQQWCNFVRSKYNAWQDSEASAPVSPPADVHRAPDRESPDAGVSSGGGLPVQENVEGVKTALEAGIEAALVGLGRRQESVLARLSELEENERLARADLLEVTRLVEYYRALKAKL